MPLEQAVRKMTARPAEIFRIPERGKLREGNFADIVVFDPQTVKEVGTFADPRRHPQGIELIMVNGAVAYGSEALLGREYAAEKPAGKTIRNLSQPKGA
jgi:N-acyl-D-amino-acid deacylase